MTDHKSSHLEQEIGPDCIVPPGIRIEPDVQIGARVVFAGPEATVRSGTVIEAASIIANNVTIGQGAQVRAGSVVLRSVPPNAIVEGNPAQVVGYKNGSSLSRGPEPRHISIHKLDKMDRPARVPLGVGDSALFLMRRTVDARGALTVGEVPSEVPFTPARYFAVFDVPSIELRGEHAHKHCQQFLICLHGSCRVLLDDGEQRCEVTLDRPDMGVFMPELIWGTQYRYSRDAVLLVFASRPYEAEDYLRTYDDFLSELESRKS